MAEIVKDKKLFEIVSILILILISIPGYISHQSRYNPIGKQPNINIKSYNFFNSIKNVISQDQFLIYLPRREDIGNFTNIYTSVISALSGREVYLENGGLPGNLEKIFKERLKNIKDLDIAIENCKTSQIRIIIEKIGSRYILTPNRYSCLKDDSIFHTLLSSGELALFLVK